MVGLGQKTVTDTTHIQVDTIAKRNMLAPGGKMRRWGMLVTVVADDKTYQLKRGLVNNDIQDNSNWQEFASTTDNSSFDIDNEYDTGDGVTTMFNVTKSIQQVIHVEIGGVIQRRGVDYTFLETSIVFTNPPPNGIEFGICYIGASAITYLESEGNILLDVPREYPGPVSGDLFVDVTGASETVVSSVDHNDFFEPVITSTVPCNLIAGVYVAGILNKILFRCNKAGSVVTSIDYLFYQP